MKAYLIPVKLQHLILLIAFVPILISACSSDKKEQGSSYVSPEEAAKKAAEEEEKSTADALANPMENKGIGPVDQVELGPIDEAMAAEGKQIYEEKCTACHKVDKKYIGPAPAGIMKRRSPEWIMNMILNPEQMVKEDPIAKELLKEYLSPMADQGLTREEARKILEYFRTI